MMQGTSRDSLAAAQQRLAAILTEPDSDPGRLADELFQIVGMLDREISLRRVLTDPAAAGDRKSGLVHILLDGKVSDVAARVVADLAAARWSRPRDIADAVETLAVFSAVAGAERAGYVDDLEDALFRFGRVVAGEPQLRAVLADRTIDPARKIDLVGGLLAGKVGSITLRLIEQVVAAPRGRTLDRGLEEYADLAAAYRRQVVALVRVAAPLTDEQRHRLSAALTRIYGHELQLNVVIDPELTGGIRVEVGGESIDGTIDTRLDEARRRLAS